MQGAKHAGLMQADLMPDAWLLAVYLQQDPTRESETRAHARKSGVCVPPAMLSSPLVGGAR